MSTQQQLSLLVTLDELKGLWQYAALGLFTKYGRKTPQEYEMKLIKIWDRLDQLSIAEVENIIVELEGRVMQKQEPLDKILLNQTSYYLATRMEQDKE